MIQADAGERGFCVDTGGIGGLAYYDFVYRAGIPGYFLLWSPDPILGAPARIAVVRSARLWCGALHLAAVLALRDATAITRLPTFIPVNTQISAYRPPRSSKLIRIRGIPPAFLYAKQEARQ